jgi:hypothetical protein
LIFISAMLYSSTEFSTMSSITDFPGVALVTGAASGMKPPTLDSHCVTPIEHSQY